MHGVESLGAAPVEGLDIRAAVGLLLMGLMAEGLTEITEIHHIDRGYDDLVGKLRDLGADVQRVPNFDKDEVVLGC